MQVCPGTDERTATVRWRERGQIRGPSCEVLPAAVVCSAAQAFGGKAQNIAHSWLASSLWAIKESRTNADEGDRRGNRLKCAGRGGGG